MHGRVTRVLDGACRWSGLIRGAVSVALVYYYFDPDGKSSDSHQSTLIATTLIEVMVSIFIFGAATKPLLDYLIGPQGAALTGTTDRPCGLSGPAQLSSLPGTTGSMWSEEAIQASVKRQIAKTPASRSSLGEEEVILAQRQTSIRTSYHCITADQGAFVPCSPGKAWLHGDGAHVGGK